MPAATHVLVIGDSPDLHAALRRVVAEVAPPGVRFEWAASAGAGSGAGPSGVAALDVRRDADRIAGDHDLVISAHCRQRFPAALVEAVRCVNVHPGYNPWNRGWYPHVFSILNGRPAGATLHEMDAELDHGPIIARREVAVLPWDTSATLYARVLAAETALLREHLAAVVAHDYTTTEPEAEGELHRRRDFERLCDLDLGERATLGELLDRLRALSHPPHKNAFFRTPEGETVHVEVRLSREGETPAED